MIVTLLSHQWKAFWRSRGAEKSLVMRIIAGLIVCYLLSIFFILGISLNRLLKELFPGQDPITIFCGFILYYFVMDLMLRFLVQDIPTLSIQPYLGQSIRRRELIAYLNIRSLFHFINLIPILLFFPFGLSAIQHHYGANGAAGFLIAVLSLGLFNHFLVLYLVRKTMLNSWWLLGFVLGYALIISSDYLGLLSLRKLSGPLFLHLLRQPWLSFVPVGLASLAFLHQRRFLLRNLYLEELSKRRKQKRSSDYAWLRQWGRTGDLAELEIKMILRNKRTKTIFLSSFFALIYGATFFKPSFFQTGRYGMMLFAGFLMSGAFTINFGQRAYTWHAGYFDGLLSSNLHISDLIRAKFYLFTAASTLTLIISTAYGFIDWRVIPLLLAAWLFNIGCTTVICLYISTFDYNRIDLGKSGAFNWQGTTGMTTILQIFGVMVIPFILYFPLAILNPWFGVVAVGGVGLINLLLRNWWIEVLTREFYKRKYRMLAGYREQ